MDVRRLDVRWGRWGTVVTVVVVLGLGCLAAAVLVDVRRRPSTDALGRIEGEVAALRKDVAGYRAAHENQMESLDRRLDGLEQTAARAANELRMASEQLVTSGRFDPASGTGVTA